MPAPAPGSLNREFAFSDGDFRFLVELVREKTGIVLADNKKSMVYSRLARRLRSLKLATFADYCALLEGEGGASELGQFVNAITTNLTSFFREIHHFEHLSEEALPEIINSNAQHRRLRVWSAGSSTGMEAYSIAIMLKERAQQLAGWDVKILATDIDTNVLATGAAGQYAREAAKDLPDAYRKKYFRESGDNLQANDELRKLVSFKPLNLLEAWPMQGKFDIVFCRNVVIYFDKPTQKILFSRIADVMKPNGWLYIGHSENLFNVCDRFRLSGRTIYRRIK